MNDTSMHKGRTYILLDIIGMTEALKAGKAADLLQGFWDTTQYWTNNISSVQRPRPDDVCGSTFGYLKVAGGVTCQPPDLYMTVLADTAILTGGREYELAEYYELAESLVAHLKRRRDLDPYFIINRADELLMPVIESVTLSGSTIIPSYIRAVGVGPAWRDIYEADKLIGQKKDWHPRYRRYCVGERSLASGYTCRECAPMESLTGTRLDVLALEH
jgi:hypothetical protein